MGSEKWVVGGGLGGERIMKSFLIFNLLSFLSIAFFFIFGYTFLEKAIYSEYLLLYKNQSKIFVGKIENLFKVGLSGIVVFLLNLIFGDFLRKHQRKEAFLFAIVSFLWQITLLIFEIQVLFLNL